jgi:tetratricopeptide (TPR) repeat protein
MSPDLPATGDYLTRFQRKIARNAASWLNFVQTHSDDPAALDRELANLGKAAQQALLEPQAWEQGLALIGAAWQHVELRGYWQGWESLLAQGVQVSQQIGRSDHQARLLDQLGEVARLMGNNRSALAHFETALALYRAQDDPVGVGRALTHLSQAQLALNDWSAASRSCREAAAIFAALSYDDDRAVVHNNWGVVCTEQGQYDEAWTHFEQAEAGFRAAGNLRGQANTLVNRSEVCRHRRQWPEAEGYLRQAMALYEALGDRLHLAGQQMHLSINVYQQGQPAEALALSQAAEEVFRQLRHGPFLARTCNNTGIFLAALDRPAEAQVAFDEAARLHLANGDRLYAADSLNNCAEILLDQGRLSEAADYLTQVRSLLETVPNPPGWVLRDYERYRTRLRTSVGVQPSL